VTTPGSVSYEPLELRNFVLPKRQKAEGCGQPPLAARHAAERYCVKVVGERYAPGFVPTGLPPRTDHAHGAADLVEAMMCRHRLTSADLSGL
jgi:hypothetical protein